MYYNEKIETMSRDEMSALQAKRLRATVERVYNNVSLYRKRMDEAGIRPEDINTVDDLKKTPFYLQDRSEGYISLRNVCRTHE